jgi:hypothetical protein
VSVYEPAGTEVHTAAPALEYVPAGHFLGGAAREGHE